MIRKNNKDVIGVFKNNTPIIRIYKGNNLVFGQGGEDYNIYFEWSGGTEIKLISKTTWSATPYTTSPVKINTDDEVSLFNVDCDYLKIYKYRQNYTNLSIQWVRCDFLDLSEYNSRHLTTLDDAFRNISRIDLTNFDTSNVNSMHSMFNNCSGLTSLDVSSFDTSNVTTMHNMLGGCSSLTSLDISNFNTSKVTAMGYMFYGCSSLNTLNLGEFDTSNATSNNGLFAECYELDTFIWNNLGKASGWGSIDLWNCTKIGQTNHQALADTFVNNSYDRASAGYSRLTLNLHSDVVARFTNEEIAQMTSKGYTISQHS